jgi:hypothetical protein
MIEDLTGAFIADALAGAVGSGSCGAAACTASELFDVQVIDGHGV